MVSVFPTPLDWAMLFNAITVATPAGDPVPGRVEVGETETRWLFTPSFSWAAGAYQVQVDPDLEDPCGNTPLAAFDRSLLTGVRLHREARICLAFFIVA